MGFDAASFFNRSWWRYRWRYLRRDTPWATDVIPSQLVDFMERTPAGTALDLGCGTGSCAIALASRGWAVTGIDFTAKAIRIARARAAREGLPIRFVHGDVTRHHCVDGVYDLALDIGCLFSLQPDSRRRYADNLARLLKPGAWYLLHAWFPKQENGDGRGISPEAVDRLLCDRFARSSVVVEEDRGRAYAWYRYQRH